MLRGLARRRAVRRARAAAALAGHVAEGPVRAYLATPPPGPDTDVRGLRLLALDLETTGLDPGRDHVLSAGFVPVDGLDVDLSRARHVVCRAGVDVGQSARFHGITDDALAAGVEPVELLDVVAEALTGRVLLAHHAVLEQTFLSVLCERTHGVRLPTEAVDTMELHRRVLGSEGDDLPAGSLRLATARSHLGLPRYRAHEALTDALACAELYLAQVARLGGERPMTLRDLQRR